MSKGKRNFRGEKELDELQRYKYENSKLKREVKSLRKQLQKNVQRYEDVKELIEHQYEEDKKVSSKRSNKNYKEKYSCHECGSGHLRIILLPIRGKVMYRRRCSNHPECKNMTDKKPYDPETVEGIFEHEDIKEKI